MWLDQNLLPVEAALPYKLRTVAAEPVQIPAFSLAEKIVQVFR